MTRPQPLAECPSHDLAQIRFVLTDIDDTLTLDGRLPACAYDAMEQLTNAGLSLVPITGRPAGWCDLIARQWPIAGIVGENGAFYFRYDEISRRMIRQYTRSADQRAADRGKLNQLRTEILAAVPGAAISADQAYREADLAIDFAEDVGPLSRDEISEIVRRFESRGAIAKVSSIHVNGWFGTYDKLSMTRQFFADIWQIDIDDPIKRAQIAFAGDSPNDQPMFSFFDMSIGVANVLNFGDLLTHPPSYVTPAPGGHGFAELAQAILAAHKVKP
jgi:HAD superfamily hydrolase (TIGR01484 family)